MRARLWHSLVLRMAAAITAVVIVSGTAIVTFEWVADRSDRTEKENAAEAGARAFACNVLTDLGRELYRGGDPGAAAKLRNLGVMPPDALYFFGDGGLRIGTPLPTPFDSNRKKKCDGKNLPSPLRLYLDRYFLFHEGLIEKGGTIYLYEKMEGRLPLSRTVLTVAIPVRSTPPLNVIAMTAFLLSLIVFTVSAIAMRFHYAYRKRIQRLNTVFDEFQAGNYSARPADPFQDEIGVLAQHIGNKLNLIEHKIVAAERVGLQVAHELKRLLTRSVQQLWLVKSRAPDPETREEIGCAIAQIVRFGTVMKDLLNLGLQAELVGGPKIEFGPVDLSALLGKVVEGAGEEIASKKLALGAAISHGICVFGSSPMLEVLFENLLENAIKYAGDAKVDLELSAAEGEFCFRLRNGLGRQAFNLPESYKIGHALIGIIANRHGFVLTQPSGSSDAFEIVVAGPLYRGVSSREQREYPHAPNEADLRAM